MSTHFSSSPQTLVDDAIAIRYRDFIICCWINSLITPHTLVFYGTMRSPYDSILCLKLGMNFGLEMKKHKIQFSFFSFEKDLSCNSILKVDFFDKADLFIGCRHQKLNSIKFLVLFLFLFIQKVSLSCHCAIPYIYSIKFQRNLK